MSLERALILARRNPIRHTPKMAAVLIRDRREIGWGWNSYKTHPLAAYYGHKKPYFNEVCVCRHAEISAIINARLDVKGADLYVARAYHDGKQGLAKPCEGCQRAIDDFGIRSIWWTK